MFSYFVTSVLGGTTSIAGVAPGFVFMIMLGGQADLLASVSALKLHSSFPGNEGLDGVDNDPSAGSPQWCILTGSDLRQFPPCLYYRAWTGLYLNIGIAVD